MSFQVADGFKLEDHGWEEIGNAGNVTASGSTSGIRETYRRWTDTLVVTFSSPITITAWSLNGIPGDLTEEAFMNIAKEGTENAVGRR